MTEEEVKQAILKRSILEEKKREIDNELRNLPEISNEEIFDTLLKGKYFRITSTIDNERHVDLVHFIDIDLMDRDTVSSDNLIIDRLSSSLSHNNRHGLIYTQKYRDFTINLRHVLQIYGQGDIVEISKEEFEYFENKIKNTITELENF